MEADIISDLRTKLDIAAEALRKAEERALAGQFALEVMLKSGTRLSRSVI